MITEYYVIIAGQTKNLTSEIILVGATSPKQADQFAIDGYRKKYGLASNVHIFTNIVNRCDTEEEGILFVTNVIEVMDNNNNNTNSKGSIEPS